MHFDVAKMTALVAKRFNFKYDDYTFTFPVTSKWSKYFIKIAVADLIDF